MIKIAQPHREAIIAADNSPGERAECHNTWFVTGIVCHLNATHRIAIHADVYSAAYVHYDSALAKLECSHLGQRCCREQKVAASVRAECANAIPEPEKSCQIEISRIALESRDALGLPLCEALPVNVRADTDSVSCRCGSPPVHCR